MRRGPNGGLLVCEPDAAPATHAIIIYLEYLGITIGDLLDARLLLEPLAASRAAQRIDEAGIDRLRAVLRAEEDRQPIGGAERRISRGVGGAVQKPSAATVYRHPHAADRPVRRRLAAGLGQRRLRGDRAPPSRPLGHRRRRHRRRRGARDDAERTTCGIGDRSGCRTTIAPAVASTSHSADREAPQGKLAEVLAAAIRDDIASSGWQVGEVFGSEVALLERYQVSRAALREAVRLLEYHAVATTRRGPGGGLVVAEPQAQASIDTIALYLQYREPRREDLTAGSRRHRDRQRRQGRRTPRRTGGACLPGQPATDDRAGRR